MIANLGGTEIKCTSVLGSQKVYLLFQNDSILLKKSSAPGLLHPIKCDLTQEKDILAMFDVIWKKFGGVDVCINNAGLAHAATLLDGDTAKWKNMTDVKSFIMLSFSTHLCIGRSLQSHMRTTITDW